MSKAAFMKYGSILAPIDQEGRDIMDALQNGKSVMVYVHPARNVRHHRMLFALLKKITEGGAWDGDTDSLLVWLKVHTRLVDTVILDDGRVVYVPRSIAFESMSQDKFARWFDRAVYIISTRLLESEDWEGLRDGIVEIVDGEQGRRAKELDERYRAA